MDSSDQASDLASDLVRIDEARGLFKVSRQAFTNPDILARERALIFNRGWPYLG